MYFSCPTPSVWLSLEAINLSNQLIQMLEIQDGTGLADLLGVNHIFFNHEAVRVWVQKEIQAGLPDDGKLDELASRFYACVNSPINCDCFLEEVPLNW